MGMSNYNFNFHFLTIIPEVSFPIWWSNHDKQTTTDIVNTISITVIQGLLSSWWIHDSSPKTNGWWTKYSSNEIIDRKFSNLGKITFIGFKNIINQLKEVMTTSQSLIKSLPSKSQYRKSNKVNKLETKKNIQHTVFETFLKLFKIKSALR